ncbi:carbohydrate kinase [Propionicimonas sp.]|uniref:carbohydrate kinase family protein n=1 Tax=Propionicimonas sp. TaxID=1955623 RepID=UPI002B2214FF|nr:carbohydrate kinase [Propionicimonas sp.]
MTGKDTLMSEARSQSETELRSDRSAPDHLSSSPQVVCIGDVVIDFTASGVSDAGNPIYECNAGGSPANVAAAVAALDGQSAFLGCVGEDDFGDLLRTSLMEAGVDVRGLVTTTEAGTRLVFIELAEDNERHFKRYPWPAAERCLRAADLDLDLLDHCKALHVSMGALREQPIREATWEAIARVRRREVPVSFDSNWTQEISVDPIRERRFLLDTGAEMDIRKLSLNELEFLFPGATIEEATDALFDSGPRLVIVTAGAQGCHYRSAAGSGFVPAFPVQALDTTGTGDTFLGALLYQLTRADTVDLDAVCGDAMYDALCFASAAGAVGATRRGSLRVMPSMADVMCMLERPETRQPANGDHA